VAKVWIFSTEQKKFRHNRSFSRGILCPKHQKSMLINKIGHIALNWAQPKTEKI